MLALTRIFLHNWHRFHQHTIVVERGARPTSYHGTDWRAILDALGLVLTADMQHAGRNLALSAPPSPKTAAAYVALEFTNTHDETAFTLGVCLEASSATPPPCTCFLFAEPLDPNHLAPDGVARSRHQLKQTLPALRSAHTYDQASEYRAEIAGWLGEMNPRFFELFGQAMTFEGPDNIRQFIDQWLLEPRPLVVETLQRVAEPYAQLTSEAREIEEKLTSLRAIVEQQESARAMRQQHAEHALFAALLRLDITRRRAEWFERQITTLHQHITTAETEQTQTRERLKNERETLLETEIQARQTSVVRRREELQREIRQATSEATMIHARWITLLHDLKREEATLRPLLDAESYTHLVREEADAAIVLTDDERATLRSLLDTIAVLDADQPPPRQLAALIDAALPALDAALARAQEVYFLVRHRLNEQRQQSIELESTLHRLQSGERTYPQEVERVCELLTHILGERPPLLCEVLEIPSERWQDVVEAMLGPRRFTILVQPRFVNIARQVLDRARTHENIYDVGVLNIGESLHQSRAIPPESLSHQVHSEFAALRPYLDAVLGDIMTCETVDQLHEYTCAVTSEVVLYREWTTRALPPHEYRPWFIGERAQRSQIETHEQVLQALNEEMTAYTSQSNAVNLHITRLKRVRALSNLRQRLDAPLDEKPLRTQAADFISRQRALDTSDVDDLLRAIENLHTSIERDEEHAHYLATNLARWQANLQQYEHDLEAARSDLDEHQQRAAEARARFAYAEREAECLLSEHRASFDTAITPDEPPSYAPLVPIEAAARSFESHLIEAAQQLTRLAAAHNSRFDFVAQESDPDESRYAEEEQRLIATELPRYQDELEDARRRAMEGLRDHVLLPLRERLQTARQQLERFNEALSRLELYGERYRFSALPPDDLRDTHTLILGAHSLEEGEDILDNCFYQAHRLDCEAFYAALTAPPRSEEEQRARERLLDYRNYYTYDLESTCSNGEKTLLSTHLEQQYIGHTARGTNLYLPFYLTIAATFAQIYRLSGNAKQRPTIRLVVLNEAFARLGKQNVGAILDTFERLGLQVVTASPADG